MNLTGRSDFGMQAGGATVKLPSSYQFRQACTERSSRPSKPKVQSLGT